MSLCGGRSDLRGHLKVEPHSSKLFTSRETETCFSLLSFTSLHPQSCFLQTSCTFHTPRPDHTFHQRNEEKLLGNDVEGCEVSLPSGEGQIAATF